MTSIKFICLVGILLGLVVDQLNATEYPHPPPVPAKFENAKEIESYLGKLHNYYMIVGRPRFGKRSLFAKPMTEVSSDEDLSEKEELTDSEFLNEVTQFLRQWTEQLKKEAMVQRSRQNALNLVIRKYEQ